MVVHISGKEEIHAFDLNSNRQNRVHSSVIVLGGGLV